MKNLIHEITKGICDEIAVVPYKTKKMIAILVLIASGLFTGIFEGDFFLKTILITVSFTLSGFYILFNSDNSELSELEIASKKGNYIYLQWLQSEGVNFTNPLGTNAIKLALTNAPYQKKLVTLETLFSFGASLKHMSDLDDFLYMVNRSSQQDSFTEESQKYYKKVFLQITKNHDEKFCLRLKEHIKKDYPSVQSLMPASFS